MSVLPQKFDELDPDFLEDPYAAYARLRRSGPLCRGGPGEWIVTRYDDVAALLRDPRLGHQFPEAFHSFSAGDGPASQFLRRIILNRDPPAHTRLRRRMAPAFSSRVVGRLGVRIGEIVDELLAPALDGGEFDAVADFAYPLPVTVVCELIGIPAADRDLVRPKAADLCKTFSSQLVGEDRIAADQAVLWLREYISNLLDDRRRRPADDLLSHLLAANDDQGGLDRDEIVDNTVFLFFAGFETTMNLIGNGCAALLDNPAEEARLRADPSLAPTAVEEFLRFDAPIQKAARMVREPVEVGGRIVRPGRVLVLLIGSANHDERQFTDPGRLDVGRDPNPHVSFGGNVHFCLGAGLARTEATLAFAGLLRRCASLERAGRPARRPGAGFRSYQSLPISVRPA